MGKYSKIPKFNLGKYSKIPKFVNIASSKKETSLMKVHSFGSFPPQILVVLRGGPLSLDKFLRFFLVYLGKHSNLCTRKQKSNC